MMDPILSSLNDRQFQAVTHGDGPLLIFAGAGSGKTRVLTHRIAWLLRERKTVADRILAVTFTNKASKEMRERLEKLLGADARFVNMGTFHSINAKILRRDAKNLDLDPNFTIYDTSDSLSVVKTGITACGFNTEMIQPNAVRHFISHCKQQRKSPLTARAETKLDFLKEKYALVYQEYEKQLYLNHAFDFDDLLLKPLEYFDSHPSFLQKYQYRYDYVLVDEYQDTNTVQFQFIEKLAARTQNICAVGDDDQSIYGWRGADIHNILNFETAFPSARVIKLEQNYRSTKTILKAAAAVVKHNIQRKDKTIWSDNPEGEGIDYIQVSRGDEEAAYIAMTILNSGRKYSEFAILYRTNAQSRLIEEALRNRMIRYTIVGGTRFYERKEIKDLLAYLNVLVNPNDTVSLRRIINVPARKIGATSMQRLIEFAESTQRTFWEALQYPAEADLPSQAVNAIRLFFSKMNNFRERLELDEAPLLVKNLIETMGLISQYQDSSKDAEAEERIHNIEEFVSGVEQFVLENEGAKLEDFLQDVALMTDVDQWEDGAESVVLMTLHSAKGLEFPHVFLAGLEDGLFPLERTIMADHELELEEERRLFYVGLTRAKQKVTITAASQRIRYGVTMSSLPSRFIAEIPNDCLSRQAASESPLFGMGAKQTKERYQKPPKSEPALFSFEKKKSTSGSGKKFKPGDRIRHQTYGLGLIRSLMMTDQLFYKIQFDNGVSKVIAAKFVEGA